MTTNMNMQINSMKDLRDIKRIENIDVAQKSKVSGGIEDDEKSKYLHGLTSRMRKQI